MQVGGRSIEYTDTGPAPGPELLFLHEALGSVGLWKGFPAAVAASVGGRAVAYSRLGHGWSDPPPAPRAHDYLSREALDVVPEVRRRLGMDRPVIVGHSDGASIAIIHAGSGADVSGLVLIAPHVFVEEDAVGGVEAARARYETTDFRARLAAHHRDADALFDAWARIWTDPTFRSWNIESSLPGITAPVLVVQGAGDEYGTLAQVDAVAAGVSGRVERLVLDGCGHSPHLEEPSIVTEAVADFLRSGS